MKITIIDYENQRNITFKNNAKGIRDFIILLNEMLHQNNINNIRIVSSYEKEVE